MIHEGERCDSVEGLAAAFYRVDTVKDFERALRNGMKSPDEATRRASKDWHEAVYGLHFHEGGEVALTDNPPVEVDIDEAVKFSEPGDVLFVRGDDNEWIEVL